MQLTESLPRLSLLAGLAGFAAMLGYVTLFWESNQPAVLLRFPEEVAIDFTASQPRSVSFDESGAPARRFSAERLVHFRNGDRSELDRPIFQATTERGTIWHGEADEGTLYGEDEVELRGNVEIEDAAATTRLRTEALRWHNPSQEVTTNVAVVLEKDTHIVRAIGMRADLNRDRVELLQQVEGVHAIH